MAIWNGNPQTVGILDLAAKWKRDCLLGDGSIIGNENLWTLENLTSLQSAFFNNPQKGPRTFIEKLSDQVDAKGDLVQRLCSEVLLILYLFPAESSIGPAKKAEKIDLIFQKTGVSRSVVNALSIEVLKGIGSSGTAFNTKMPN